jgi:hypothetical protein
MDYISYEKEMECFLFFEFDTEINADKFIIKRTDKILFLEIYDLYSHKTATFLAAIIPNTLTKHERRSCGTSFCITRCLSTCFTKPIPD